MKQLLNGILNVIGIIFLFFYALIATIILWWPAIAFFLIIPFIIWFVLPWLAYVLIALLFVLFLMIILAKIFIE